MITFEQTVPPTAKENPATMAEARSQCRVTTSDDDAEIRRFMLASMDQLDGYEGLLGRCLLEQTWVMRLDRWPGRRWHEGPAPLFLDQPTARQEWRQGILRVPLAPIVSIDTITYIDTSEVEQTLSLATLDIELAGDYARVKPLLSAAWPNISATALAPIHVTFTAGYGEDNIPRPIVQAILLKTGRWFDHRHTDFENAGWSNGEMALIQNYRLTGQWRA